MEIQIPGEMHPKTVPTVPQQIWFRHYQVAPLTEEDANDPERQILTEIGPRFVLDPIHVLDGSFALRREGKG